MVARRKKSPKAEIYHHGEKENPNSGEKEK